MSETKKTESNTSEIESLKIQIALLQDKLLQKDTPEKIARHEQRKRIIEPWKSVESMDRLEILGFKIMNFAANWNRAASIGEEAFVTEYDRLLEKEIAKFNKLYAEASNYKNVVISNECEKLKKEIDKGTDNLKKIYPYSNEKIAKKKK